MLLAVTFEQQRVLPPSTTDLYHVYVSEHKSDHTKQHSNGKRNGRGLIRILPGLYTKGPSESAGGH